MNEARIRNTSRLTAGLRATRGIRTAHQPSHAHNTYYDYVIRLLPVEFGLNIPVADFRDKVVSTLTAEGVNIGQWQRMPVPCQTVFQSRVGLGKGYLWRSVHDRDVAYRAEDYPCATAFIESVLYVRGIGPPNDERLMDRCVEAIRKVFGAPDQIMAVT